MAQKDQELILRRAPHVDIVVGPGQLGQVPELLAQAKDERRAADGRQPGRATPARATTVDGELRELRPAPRAGDAAEPVPGVRPDHDRLRQVLHLLHRPVGPRPRAEPAARRDRRRGAPARRPGGARRSRCSARPSTATSTASPTAGPPGSPTCSTGSTTSPGIERIKFVTNFPNDMTDDLLEAVRDLPKVCPLPARPGAERLRRGAEADEADVHGRVLRRHARPHPRDGARRGGLQRLHRRLLRRDRGVVREDRATWSSGPVQEQLHLQVQPAAGDEGRRRSSPTTCPRRSRSGGTTTCWRSRTAISLEDNRAFVGRTVEVLVEGPSKSAARARGLGRARPADRAGRRATGSWSSRGTSGWSGRSCRSRSRTPARSPCSGRW